MSPINIPVIQQVSPDQKQDRGHYTIMQVASVGAIPKSMYSTIDCFHAVTVSCVGYQLEVIRALGLVLGYSRTWLQAWMHDCACYSIRSCMIVP